MSDESTVDLTAQFDAVEKEITAMEEARQTQTKEFVDLLRRKRDLSDQLKRFTEVNNCEMRIRFIEARMRGEEMPQTEMINFERKERRKRRNKTNTVLLLLVAVVVMMIGSVPVLKMMMDRNAAVDSIISSDDASAVVTPPADTPPPAPPPVSTTTTGNAVEELNSETGGKEIDLNKVLQPGRMTVLEFHSIHCPSCLIMAKQYEKLAQQYPSWKFYSVDVDRPFSEDIDRESPVCKQFNVKSFPHFIIFNGTTKESEGKQATAKLQELSMAK